MDKNSQVRNKLDFIKSTEGIRELICQENLPDWYVIEYADEIGEEWSHFIKFHGASQEIKDKFQTEIKNHHRLNEDFFLCDMPDLWIESHMMMSLSKNAFKGYKNKGLLNTFDGKSVGFKSDKFAFEICIDYRNTNIISIIIYSYEDAITISHSLEGFPIYLNEENLTTIYNGSKLAIDSVNGIVSTLIDTQKDTYDTISRGLTLKSEVNIIENQDLSKKLIQVIKSNLKEELIKICQNLKN